MFKLFFILLISFNCFSQSKLSELLNKKNNETIPYIHTKDLKNDIKNIVLLDAREPKEYNVSHINNAVYVGYNGFNINETINKLPKDKNTKIVVYCSLGIRSEDIGEEIKKAGYSNVFNLYGGIFEWKNNDNNVVNSKNESTEKVHSYNKYWSKWLKKGTKVYD